jgi:anaerobic magnesium-protoporphyrin IX monomethyl ester cyclase
MSQTRQRALLVDLNNFARYPTLAIGYLVAALREGGLDVDVLTPLSHGVPPVQREGKETAWEQLERRIYFSSHPLMTAWHDFLRARRAQWKGRPHPLLLEELGRRFDEGSVDVILLSAYVDQYATVRAVGELAAEHGVPLLVGGPVFNIPGVAAAWLDIPGLAAVVGAEVDLTLAALVDDLLAGRDLTRHPGVFLSDGREGVPAAPLVRMDKLPIPDFSDFPWDRYPGRVVPVMTARGCNWARCLFCADIATANGRGFRSRPVEAVLGELETQAERYATRDFIFLDLKLNSNLEMWHAVCDGFRERLPGARWIGWVHVQSSGDNGLSRRELEAAREAGLTRTTFGFETGSQRLNDSMAKGTRIDETSRFIRDAHAAGISVRMTAMIGYPGETKQDLEATIRFLDDHLDDIDRVRVGLFKPIPGSGFQERYDGKPSRYPGITRMDWDFRYARAEYDYEPARDRGYRSAKTRLLKLIHDINRRPLPAQAQVFDGLM